MNNQIDNDLYDKKESFISVLGKNLVLFRENSGMNRTTAARKIGVSHSTLQSWEEDSSRVPNAWDLKRIAEVYNISVQDLFSENGNSMVCSKIEDLHNNHIHINDYVYIPRYDVQASAGYGACILAEKVLYHIALNKNWIENTLCALPQNIIAMGVSGDSMKGVIDHNDTIFVDLSDKKMNNGIYVMRINGDLIVKQVERLPGENIIVSSANPSYSDFEISLKEDLPSDFECIGRVKAHVRAIL